MQVTLTFTEVAHYSSTVEVDEASVFDFLRDSRDAEGRVEPLPEQLSEADVLAYLHADDESWIEQVRPRDFQGVSERDLEHVKF